MTKDSAKLQARREAAFMDYCQIGLQRSIGALADMYKERTKHALPGEKIFAPNVSTLRQWSAKYHWQQRVGEYDIEQIKREAQLKETKRLQDIDKMNERHALIGTTQQARAIEQIKKLMDAQAFGSIAAVQLLKLAIETERLARNLPDKKVEITGKDGGAIMFETDWGGGVIEE